MKNIVHLGFGDYQFLKSELESKLQEFIQSNKTASVNDLNSKQRRPPVIVCYAGPNGSGKSTLTYFLGYTGVYVNADDIQRANQCDTLVAAKSAERMRKSLVNSRTDFTFETVMSTERNLKLLQYAKSLGYRISIQYVLTRNADINVARVKQRVAKGGHDVPEDKIRLRYERCLKLLPEIVKVSDICNVFDNTMCYEIIYSKDNTDTHMYPNDFWTLEDIKGLVECV